MPKPSPKAIQRQIDRINKIRRHKGMKPIHPNIKHVQHNYKKWFKNHPNAKYKKPKGVRGTKAYRNFIPNDAIFQQQKSGYQKTLEDYLAQNKYERGQVQDTYHTAKDRLQQEIGRAHTGILGEAAGRGMLYSGSPLYNTNQYDIQAAQQQADLVNSRKQQLEALRFGRQQTRSTIGTQTAAARQAAVQRRAMRFGLM